MSPLDDLLNAVPFVFLVAVIWRKATSPGQACENPPPSDSSTVLGHLGSLGSIAGDKLLRVQRAEGH